MSERKHEKYDVLGFYAFKTGNIDLAKYCLNENANLTKETDHNGWTVRDYAGKNDDLIRLIDMADFHKNRGTDFFR